MPPTNTDTGGQHEWIHDEPSGWSVWGTSTAYLFPAKDATIGSADDCWLQFDDPRVSKYHARLTRLSGRLKLYDLESKNGIRCDGVRKPSILLAPGAEIGIGRTILIVESPLLIELRELLARLIGWSDARRADVDGALRSVRMAATRRQSLLLCGAGHLVSIARLLHSRTLGDDRPFVVCDPRRQDAKQDARAAINYDDGMVALKAATGGTICVWRHRPLPDFDQVIAKLARPTSRVRLVSCTHQIPDPHEPAIGPTIVLPPLSERASELTRIVDSFAGDAVAAFGGTFTSQSRDWVLQYESTDLSSIMTATRRLVALNRAGGNATQAAVLLGMSKSSLREWFAARPGGYT